MRTRPIPLEPEGITCLRCRHCRATPDTDFSKLLKIEGGRVVLDLDHAVPIHCAKQGRNRPARLWDECSLASGHFQRPVGHWNKAPKGDKTRGVGEVEARFVRALYPHWPLARLGELLRATGRSRQTLYRIAGSLGVVRLKSADDAREQGRRCIEGRAQRGSAFNAAQTAFVFECRDQGLYPVRARGGRAFRDKQEQLRRELLDGVAARGAPKTWRQIVQHVHTLSPANRRRERRLRPRKYAK